MHDVKDGATFSAPAPRSPTASAILEARTGALEPELVDVEGAEGRVAAADVAAAIDVPHFTRAAMDGERAPGARRPTA